MVRSICAILDSVRPTAQHPTTAHLSNYAQLITHVADRPGHDVRYAIDAGKIERDLGWKPQECFESGIRKTVLWYLNHPAWWQAILNGQHQSGRLGLGETA